MTIPVEEFAVTDIEDCQLALIVQRKDGLSGAVMIVRDYQTMAQFMQDALDDQEQRQAEDRDTIAIEVIETVLAWLWRKRYK